jgi:hypothetical protein
MDQSCYKCGHTVEFGKAFCPQCGAPQIRVVMPEAVPAVVGNLSATGMDVLTLDPPDVRSALSAASFSTGIAWRRAFWACAGAAFVILVVTSLRIVPPLLAQAGGGFMAVLLYYRRNPDAIVSVRAGAKIGALTGLLSSGVSAFFFTIFVALMRTGGDVQREMMESLQQFSSRISDPQVQAAFDLLKTPEGINKLGLGIIGFCLISIAVGSLAGALTAAFLGRRKHP